MARQRIDPLTVTPPNLDRLGFERVDQALAVSGPSMRREWLLARFSEGLQLRLLRDPHLGLIAFTPARAAWVPIRDAGKAVVVHDLRVGPESDAPGQVRRLWDSVEEWARFYGFASVLALSGTQLGLIPPELVTGRRYQVLDETTGGIRLVGKVLTGPITLPQLPQDWGRRAGALGPGLVVQTTGRAAELERQAEALVTHAQRAGMIARHHRLDSVGAVREQAVSPAALFSVVFDGEVLPSDGLSDMQLWSMVARLAADRRSA